MVQGIKGDHSINMGRGKFQLPGNEIHHLFRDPSKLLLGNPEDRQQGSLFGRVVLQNGFYFFLALTVELFRFHI
jgi:hypothetical protein